MKIPDEELMEWIRDGSIIVDLVSTRCWYKGKEKTATIVGMKGKNGTRYRFEFCVNRRRRTIVRSKLVYMAGSDSLVEPGYELHHLDEDRYNDAYSNLIKLTCEDHKKIHGVYEVVSSHSGIPF